MANEDTIPNYALPWFPLVVASFLDNPKIKNLSPLAYMVHLKLLMHSWREGSLPYSMQKLAHRAEVSKPQMMRAWNEIGGLWLTGPNLTLYNEDLERLRTESDTKRVKKRNAANTRWKNPKSRI